VTVALQGSDCKAVRQKRIRGTDVFQSKSATTSLLIQSCKCVKEEIKLIVLAQKSKNIVETCRMKQRRISPAERDQRWMGAVEEEVPLILYVISIAQVTTFA